MKIRATDSINFKRRLKPSEEAEYCDVLKKAHGRGKKILIVPASSLPNETGVGNLGTKESLDFFDFAKKYWGINEIQILPMGQYHEHHSEYPIYSGTSMELGNHVINIKNYIPSYNVKSNSERVNFHNVVDKDSPQEKALRELYSKQKLNKDFEKFKSENAARLEPKAVYRALCEINGTHRYMQWNETDRNLYDLAPEVRAKRIEEIKKLKSKEMDFYYFKQFLAEDSLKKAKEELNKKGLKLNGDMLCGFSFDEVWANPKAFHKDKSIGWGLPALNLDSPEGEKLLREKVKFYAERYDGFRIDAAWTYVNQPLIKDTHKEMKFYDGKILEIIDDEVKKVKGANFDLKNLMFEFAASDKNFNLYDGSTLKPCVKDRVKIYTSANLSDSWGSNKNFLERNWRPDSFIIGVSNHDSKSIEFSEEQAKTLSKILKIPYEKLTSKKEFKKAKFAEPIGAQNNMIYFMDVLNIDGQFLENDDKLKNYTTQIPRNYQDKYFKALENGEGFNPMDAFEKNFKARGLDKTDPKLFKKIVKYRKILEQKETQTHPAIKWACGIACAGLMLYGLMKYHKNHSQDSI